MVLHLFIEWEYAAKIMTDVLDTDFKNELYRRNGLNHRRFRQISDYVGLEYDNVIYYPTLRWPSRGAVLSRYLCLRD